MNTDQGTGFSMATINAVLWANELAASINRTTSQVAQTADPP
jgi:hypothetical protein